MCKIATFCTKFAVKPNLQTKKDKNSICYLRKTSNTKKYTRKAQLNF